jgi:hypothetical protein
MSVIPRHSISDVALFYTQSKVQKTFYCSLLTHGFPKNTSFMSYGIMVSGHSSGAQVTPKANGGLKHKAVSSHQSGFALAK